MILENESVVKSGVPVREVVITGVGVTAPNGIGLESFWESLMVGRSGLGPITRFDPSGFRSRIAGEVEPWNPLDYMTRESAKTSGRFAQFCIASGRMAWDDAGLANCIIPSDRVGICAGSTIGSPNEIYADQYKRFLEKGPRGVSPFSSAEYTPHAATARTAIELGIRGLNHTISTGCSTALDTLGWGVETIRQGLLDVAVVGAADSVLTPFYFATLDVLGILSDDNDHPETALRPYDRSAVGSVASEGGGMFVLESFEHAMKRGARMYARVAAYAGTNESSSMIMNGHAPEAIAEAIGLAMKRAQITPAHLDYICSHGVGIPHYDVGETLGFKKALGAEAYRIPISSIKSLTGQAYAGGGAFQIASAVNSVRTGIIPPTYNHREPLDGCDLDYVPSKPRRNDIEYCLLNSQSVGGSHSVIILGRVDA